MIRGASYFEGVRPPSGVYSFPNILENREISFNPSTAGTQMQVKHDVNGLVHLTSAAGDENSSTSLTRGISLTWNKDTLLKLNLSIQASKGTRSSMIDLSSPLYKEGVIEGILFQEKEVEGEEDASVEIFDKDKNNWNIVHPERFTRGDVESAVTQAIQNVEELLKNVKISGNLSIASDIIKILTGFGDDALYVMQKLKEEQT